MAMQEASPASAHTAQVVGNAFVEQYYHILHHSPELVHRFYQDSSSLSRPDINGSMTTVTSMQASIFGFVCKCACMVTFNAIEFSTFYLFDCQENSFWMIPWYQWKWRMHHLYLVTIWQFFRHKFCAELFAWIIASIGTCHMCWMLYRKDCSWDK